MKLRILGAGGHAKVALEAWRSAGGEVAALHDDRPELRGRSILGVPVAGDVAGGMAGDDPLHAAIGDNRARERIVGGLADSRFPPVIHAGARISPSASIGAGTLVCLGALVQAEARIGRHVIVNSGALVEHDCEIGDFAHIAPGVRLGGAVRVGAGVLVGIGAVVLPGIAIGPGAIVGAGSVVLRDVAGESTVAGNPAAPLPRR